MSALMKSAQGIASLPLAKPVVPEPAVDPRDALIALLRQEVAQLQAAAQRAATAQDARIADAVSLAEGRARDAIRRDDAARTAVLDKALGVARTALDERLALLDRLAPALARIVLERLFATADDRATLVEAMIVRRLEAFRRGAVIAVAVSAADIDETALAALGARLNGITVRHDPRLAGGQCRIEARSESLPLDLAVEWTALAATLDAMAEGSA